MFQLCAINRNIFLNHSPFPRVRSSGSGSGTGLPSMIAAGIEVTIALARSAPIRPDAAFTASDRFGGLSVRE